jgi:hypothetical protein
MHIPENARTTIAELGGDRTPLTWGGPVSTFWNQKIVLISESD